MQQFSTKAVGGPSLDETGLCLLSLDGGGVRGLSTLLILKRLMERTNSEREELGLDPVKPCELFDLIGGTSTGGLIAIMLGRLKMDVSECIQAYTSMFERIFEKQKHKYPVNLRENFGYLQNKFDSDILRGAIRKIVEDRGLNEAEYFNSEEDRTCRVFVCAVDFEITAPVCLRDYNLVDESNDDSATIVEAALATSAATTFFEPVTIGVRRYVDGALGRNNPIRSVWTEAQNIWCPEDGHLEPMIKCLVSIGTGNPGLTSVREDVKGFLLETLKRIATETENTADQSFSQHRGLLEKKRYFRYNVEQGLQDVGLEEYRKQALIESTTRTYLANELQKRSLRDCAKNLRMKQSLMPMNLKIESLHVNQIASTHFRVPARSSGRLTGRDDIMSRLEKLMAGSDAHTRVVLYGFGGIGKTRIAREFAYKWQNSNTTSVFWVHAGSRQRIEKDYLDIAKEVGVPGWQDPEFDQLGMVKDWFEKNCPGRWILILNNADDIDMLYGKPSRLADYFPRATNGAILLTTRNRKVGTKFTGSDRSLIHIDSLPLAESVRLLKDRIGCDSSEEYYAHLATALHNVPLALVQAASYILMESLSISEYLSVYEHSDAAKTQLLGDDFEDDIRDKDTQNAVALTLMISFEQIKKSDSAAAEMLSFMSMLDPQAIPRSLLPCDENPAVFTTALGTLQAFSLINKSSRQAQEDELYDLHRLVRLIMFEYLRRNNELEEWMGKATLIMKERFPGDHFYSNREICSMYFPHCAVLLSSLKRLNDSDSSQVIRSSFTSQMEMESDLLFIIADYLKYKGEYQLGQSMMQRSLAIRDRLLGPEHEKTLDCACEMIWWLDEEGKTEQAIQLGRTMLPRAQKTLGRDHETTLWTMCYLGLSLNEQKMHEEAGQILERAAQRAQKKFGEEDPLTLTAMEYFSFALEDQGKYARAEQIMRKTLQIRTKVHGEERRTFTCMSNLADTLARQDKHEEAEQMARQALQLQKKILGEEHPDTLRSMSDLAVYLNDQNEHEKAEQMARQALQLQKKIPGEEHPDTLLTMSNLAVYLYKQNKHEEAEQVARQALQLQKRVLGEEHPLTLSTMSDWACFMNKQNKHEEAEQMARQALQLQKKVLGEEHLHTLKTMSNLAVFLNNQNKHEEAEQVARRALQLRRKILGQEHPDTLQTMSSLAFYLDDQNKHEEAEQMARQALQLQKRVLGEEHPLTLLTMSDWAHFMNKQKKHEEAEQMARQALQLRKKVLGEEHPDTLRTMSDLAVYLNDQNEHEKAEQMARQALQLQKKILGQEHPHTLLTMSNLAVYWNKQNKHEKAEQMARQTLQLRKKIRGEEHPDTLLTMSKLAVYLNNQNKHEEAEQIARQALQLRKKILGQDHRDTVYTTWTLIIALNGQGKHEEARMMKVQLQESEEPSHNSKIRSLRNSGLRQGVLSRFFRLTLKDRR